ncbi:MAG: hypothetical protein F6K36_27145 [Symploca sp. SIO3C6]|uniref:Uncharacterized protein n=1 Tax=Symploca sp. SIO1C4 TaxID=2607765 RepID=A0A6B3NDC5_9CYAN|nr:hypothetical protein [Symploca sp. SIO3C6]NER28612.1 hypothetical protein [Symploca sp. SIO1C4]
MALWVDNYKHKGYKLLAMAETGIKYTQGTAQYYVEKLGNQVELEMGKHLTRF